MLQRIQVRNRWKSIFKPWEEADPWLFATCIGLTIFGGIMIRSVEINQGLIDWWRHWVTGGVGLFLAIIISRCRYQILIQWKWPIYILINLSLIAVRFIGTTGLGAQRWIQYRRLLPATLRICQSRDDCHFSSSPARQDCPHGG